MLQTTSLQTPVDSNKIVSDLERRVIDRNDVFRRRSVWVDIDGGESGNDFGSGLDAAEKRGDKDTVNRKPTMGSDSLAGSKGPNHTVVNERRIPWSLRG